jgi:hypothetical protein
MRPQYTPEWQPVASWRATRFTSHLPSEGRKERDAWPGGGGVCGGGAACEFKSSPACAPLTECGHTCACV